MIYSSVDITVYTFAGNVVFYWQPKREHEPLFGRIEIECKTLTYAWHSKADNFITLYFTENSELFKCKNNLYEQCNTWKTF